LRLRGSLPKLSASLDAAVPALDDELGVLPLGLGPCCSFGLGLGGVQ
jgi:hypothetical protein